MSTTPMKKPLMQAAEQTQNHCDKKLRRQDLHIEAPKDVKSVDEALLLLRNLRDGLQISDSAHESLFKHFMLLSKDKQELPAHLDTERDTQSPSARRDAEMVDEAVRRAAEIKVPKRQSALRPFKHKSSKRQQLTSAEAAEIYSMRPEVAKGLFLRKGCMIKSKMIAPHFGVDPRTVRDIWNARTWVSATRHLWTDEEIALRAKGAVLSDDEDKNTSSGSASPAFSMDNFTRQNLPQNMVAGQFTSLPPITSFRNQAMIGGMSALPFQLPFTPSIPSALAHHFSSVGQQQAAMSGLRCNRPAQQYPMSFAGCHPGFGMGAQSLVLPQLSPLLLNV